MTTPSLVETLAYFERAAKNGWVVGGVDIYAPVILDALRLLASLTPIGNGIEPRGCPTPGACSCTPAALTAPIAGMELETTEEERTWWGEMPLAYWSRTAEHIRWSGEQRLLRDFDRLAAALAAEKERGDGQEADARDTREEYARLNGQKAQWKARAERAEAALKEAKRLLKRYREETPLGHQPHMIAHEVDAALSPNPTTKEKS